MSTHELHDAADRQRAESEVHRNFCVEAGAGSGKTTTIVRRIRSMVDADIPLDQVAAVTFTRAAAAELRTRMIAELDETRRAAETAGDAARAARFARALVQLDAAYVGTIHGFCARLLRERPVEAQLDPDFVEVEGAEWHAWVQEWLHAWRAAHEEAGARAFSVLRELHVTDRALLQAFATIVDEPDVDFAAQPVPLPTLAATDDALAVLRAAIEPLLGAIPAIPVEDRRDAAQHKLLGVRDAMERAAFITAPEARRIATLLILERLAPSEASDDASNPSQAERVAGSLGKVVGKLWTVTRKSVVDTMIAEFAGVVAAQLLPLVMALRAHRHALAMEVLLEAREAFAAERARVGRLGFADLLIRAAALLRSAPQARAALGARFTRLIVDEFQDTDPVQAELCFLLAAPREAETDWRLVSPEPGRLFVVGDPKQSIYRFRRADLAVYAQACARIVETGGAQLRFTANFRSTHAIGRFVNAHFALAFAEDPSDVERQQAAYAPLDTVKAEVPDGGVQFVVHEVEGKKEGALHEDAAESAARIAARLRDADAPMRPGDVLVLARRHSEVRSAARALAAAGVPVAADGLGDADAPELHELLLIVEALLAPTEEVPVVAALMGPVAGTSLAELHAARQAGAAFDLVTPIPDAVPGPVAAGLMQLQSWWEASAVLPADVLLGRILDVTGLFPWAASGALGAVRAGKLLALLDAVRAGERTLDFARTLLEQRASRDSVPARSLSGADGAARVMTVHGAKGLEARLVHVVGPAVSTEAIRKPSRIVRREASGRSTGIVPLRDDRTLLGAPPEWESLLATEERRDAEEHDRLRYVAVTRAKESLRLSLALKHTKARGAEVLPTFAAPFQPQLDDVDLATQVELQPPLQVALTKAESPAPAATRLDTTPAFRVESVTIRAGTRAGSLAAASELPSDAPMAIDYLPDDLEALLAEESDAADDRHGAVARPRGGDGRAWGRTVHRAIEGALRGRQGEAFQLFCAAVVADEFPQLDATAQADKLVQLQHAVANAQASPEWVRLSQASFRTTELGLLALEGDGTDAALVEVGVVDAAGLDEEGWIVIDWKTTGAAAFEAKRREYEAQVESYAKRLTARHAADAAPRLVHVPSHRIEEPA